MIIEDNILKRYLKNVYFINGTAAAGKSTICKMLAEKYDMILCEENYKYGDFLSLTTPQSHPNMNYFNTMGGWEEFVTRDKEDYVRWMKNVSREMVPFEIIELISLSKDKKVIVDTNIPHDILINISDRSRVAYMVATPEISAHEFFNRIDEEKQFLLKVIQNTDKPDENLQKYKETILYANREEVIKSFTESGYFFTERESIDDDIYEKLRLIEEHFGFDK